MADHLEQVMGVPSPLTGRVVNGGHTRKFYVGPTEQQRQRAGFVGIAADVGVEMYEHNPV